MNSTCRGNIMHKKLFMVSGILLAAMMSACAADPHVERGTIAVGNEDFRGAIIFSAHDREKIVHHYKNGKKRKKMPPGLAKKQELPPGLQKHIKKHGQLPPGLEARRLPDSLERTLSRLPEGYVRMKVGGDVVLMNEKTRVVFDVVWGLD
jgi:Ni/Co efflux regulator RcnB